MINRNLVAIGVIFGLLQLANLTEILSYLSRPLVTGTASLLGIEAFNRGTDIVLGSVVLPWTQDCSGVNTLIILWGVTLWANRLHTSNRQLFYKLLLCIPAALVANMLRIFTLAAYRYVFYPAWESDELHYFIGLLWLIPFLFLFVDDLRRMDRARWVEIIYLSLILALIAAQIYSPGGSIVALSTLFLLAHSQFSRIAPGWSKYTYAIWITAGLFIAWSSMESLWIPWLLLCPRLIPREVIFSISGIIILSGTISVIAMQPEWQLLIGVVLAYRVILLVRGKLAFNEKERPVPGKLELPFLILMGLAPFSLSSIVGLAHPVETPPTDLMARQLTLNSYQVKVAGQPTDLRMYWYGSYGDGRHHSLESCMRFRGVYLESVPGQPGVRSGSDKWMKDYYIHDGKLYDNYRDYLFASFLPFSPPGVHIILDAPTSMMSPHYFSVKSDDLVNRIYTSLINNIVATNQ